MKTLQLLESHFASAPRDPVAAVRRNARRVVEHPIVRTLLESIDGHLLVLNRCRQILAANQGVIDALKEEQPSAVIGKRPGEAFECIHAREEPGGCGTSRHCGTCGAVIAILAAQSGDGPATGLCRMLSRAKGTLHAAEYSVRATPLRVGEVDLTVVVLHDVSDTQRRRNLERLFLHDLSNLTCGIQGWSELLLEGSATPEEAAQAIVDLARRLADEISGQRALVSAERGDLVPNRRSVAPAAIVDEACAILAGHPDAQLREIVRGPHVPNPIVTDSALLRRVLGNMLHNALESTRPGGQVRIWTERSSEDVVFRVWNEGGIPTEVQLQIFQRSFSTKGGVGRGQGTYGMKLLGERYLGGAVSFTTSAESGTVFSIALPEEAPTA